MNHRMNKRTYFGTWLEVRREALGFTQEALAELACCTLADIQTIEGGLEKPSLVVARLLARALEVPSDEEAHFVLFATSDLGTPSRPDPGPDGHDRQAYEAPWRLSLRPPSNLPAQLTSFVGRDAEIMRVAELIRGKGGRLLTLLGPPGIGKTRLCLEVANQLLDDFEDGIFFVPLAPTTGLDDAILAIASIFNIKDSTGPPLLDAVKSFLSARKLLLVLDNLEQLTDAGLLVAGLLVAAPGLRILATSRAWLHTYGEQVFRVPPLKFPQAGIQVTPESLAQSEAANLFVERAHLANPDFSITEDNAPFIAEICRRLDGLPLAIELAAARTNILSPQVILARLQHRLDLLTGGPSNLPPRQRTLRGAVDWSYDLLDSAERALFRRLSVFAGGFDFQVASRLWDISPCRSDVDQVKSMNGRHPGPVSCDPGDLLASLVDKSLIRQEDYSEGAIGDLRFTMLETIREYGLERLAELGEAEAVYRAHALVMTELVEQAEPHLLTPTRASWLARLQLEHDNLRAALTWALGESGDPELGLRLASGLHWFWYFSNSITEGRGWLTTALSKVDRSHRSRVLAKALYASGRLAQHYMEHDMALPLLEESISIWEELEDYRDMAYALVTLALTQMDKDNASSHDHIERAIALFRSAGDKWGLAYALEKFSNMTYSNLEGALNLKNESLALYQELGDQWYTAYQLGMVGMVAMSMGHYAQARSRYEEAMQIDMEVGDKWGMAWLLHGLGNITHLEGDYTRADALYTESQALYRELGDKVRMGALIRHRGQVSVALDRHEQATTQFREAIVVHQAQRIELGIRLDLAGIAGIAVGQKQPQLAAKLLGAAIITSEATTGRMSPVDLEYYKRNIEELRAQLGKARLKALLAEGQALSLEAAVTASRELRLTTLPADTETWSVSQPAVSLPAGLTKREIEVLRLLALGLSDAQIATRLSLSSNTVHSHLYSIYSKLDVTSRTAAARFVTNYQVG